MSDGAGKGVTAVTALIERLGISTDKKVERAYEGRRRTVQVAVYQGGTKKFQQWYGKVMITSSDLFYSYSPSSSMLIHSHFTLRYVLRTLFILLLDVLLILKTGLPEASYSVSTRPLSMLSPGIPHPAIMLSPLKESAPQA